MRIVFLLLLLTGLVGAQPVRYILSNGVIHTATEEAFQGYVVVQGEKVESVGRGAPPAGEVIDLQGAHLYPGLIDADSAIGLVEVESLRATRDHREVGKLNPNLVARYAFRAESDLIPVARSQGVLYSGVNPSGSLISGQGSVMRLWGWTWEDMTMLGTWALSVDWPSVNVGLSVKEKEKALGRIGEQLFFLDDAFEEARSYRDSQVTDVKWGALQPYSKGKAPVLIRVQDKDEIRSALDWSKKQGVQPILVGGRKLHFFAEELAARKISVIYVSVFNQNPDESQSYDLHYRTPKLLMEKGVNVALSPNGMAFDVRELRDLAGRARAFGASKLEALQMVTLNPARILGVADRIGSIAPGKDASFVLCNGDILEVAPEVTRAWGAGRELDLLDRQKSLYQKYRRRLLELRTKDPG
jgi:imidazolonepropionase-like amidohydrolase